MRCDPDYIQEQLQDIGCGGQSEPTIGIVGKFVARWDILLATHVDFDFIDGLVQSLQADHPTLIPPQRKPLLSITVHIRWFIE